MSRGKSQHFFSTQSTKMLIRAQKSALEGLLVEGLMTRFGKAASVSGNKPTHLFGRPPTGAGQEGVAEGGEPPRCCFKLHRYPSQGESSSSSSSSSVCPCAPDDEEGTCFCASAVDPSRRSLRIAQDDASSSCEAHGVTGHSSNPPQHEVPLGSFRFMFYSTTNYR